jgi:hypothetical protein
MVEIGKINMLEVVNETNNGLYLDGQQLGEILMPHKFITEDMRNAGCADVLVYSDSEDRLVATTEKPLAMVGDFAFLKVVSVCKFGAFLDWGLPKDLLVAFREKKADMVEGRSYLVFVDLLTKRIAASVKRNSKKQLATYTSRG